MRNRYAGIIGIITVFSLPFHVCLATPLTSYRTSGDTLTAIRTSEPINLDGYLHESSWHAASPVSGFIQMEQVEGEAASEKTEVRIVYDDENVYVGVICHDSDPEAIIHNELNRDTDLVDDDNFTMVLDTFSANRSGYFFEINPNGARYDGFFYGGELINDDWDGVWDAAARITDDGWSAEMMIPLKILRYPNTAEQAWTVNFMRIIRRKNETVLWRSWKRDDGIYQLTRAGKLLGITVGKGRRSIEFEPYILTGAEENSGKSDSEFNTGFDITYPITSDLKLDVTTFTDFAQVETDEERINLTRFSLYYPEKRDFFLESAEIYDFDTGYFEKVYHSRRIGISPEREGIDILGGVNLGGKIGDYSLGVLNITTDKEDGYPRSNYSVVRLKKDVLKKSRIGFMATNLYDADDHQNTTIGVDGFYQTDSFLNGRNFAIRGDLTGSITDGEYDDNLFGRVFIDYPNDLIDSFVEFYHVGGEFNPEVGFITRRGIRRANGAIRIYPRPPLPFVNKLIFKPLQLNYIADLDGRLLERTLSFWPIGVLTTTDDLVRMEVETSHDKVEEPFNLLDFEIPAGTHEWTDYGVFMQTSKSRPYSVNLEMKRGTFYDGDRAYITTEHLMKISRFLNIAAIARYNDIERADESLIAREYGGKFTVNASTRLTTSTYIQYNNELNEVNLNFRLHYMPNIRSDIYIVYNHLWDEAADYDTLYRTGISKISYVFRF